MRDTLQFRFEGVGQWGGDASGMVEAVSEEDAIEELKRSGVFVSTIKSLGSSRDVASAGNIYREWVGSPIVLVLASVLCLVMTAIGIVTFRGTPDTERHLARSKSDSNAAASGGESTANITETQPKLAHDGVSGERDLQAASVAAIRKQNGIVRFDEERLNQPVVWVNLFATKATDADLVHLCGLSSLRYLNLDSTKVTDAGMFHLAGLTELRTLDLSSMPVTDAGH